LSVSPEQQLRTALLADPTVASFLTYGSPAIGHFWEGTLPQNITFPSATYQRVTTTRLYAHDGPADTGWIRFQISIWCQSKTSGADAITIALAVINAIKALNASGLASDGPKNFVLNQRLDIEPNTQPPIFKQILDMRVYFRDQ
jgi:Protein of unknown function (DUF3168)